MRYLCLAWVMLAIAILAVFLEIPVWASVIIVSLFFTGILYAYS